MKPSAARSKRAPGKEPPGRPVNASRTEMTELVLPQDANLLGNILGGRVMHLIDIAGAIAAHRHCHRQVVTASVDHLDFLNPVRVGDLIVLEAQVNRAFHTSVEVGVEVYSEDSVTGARKHTTKAFLTYVARGRCPQARSRAPSDTQDSGRDSALPGSRRAAKGSAFDPCQGEVRRRGTGRWRRVAPGMSFACLHPFMARSVSIVFVRIICGAASRPRFENASQYPEAQQFFGIRRVQKYRIRCTMPPKIG